MVTSYLLIKSKASVSQTSKPQLKNINQRIRMSKLSRKQKQSKKAKDLSSSALFERLNNVMEKVTEIDSFF